MNIMENKSVIRRIIEVCEEHGKVDRLYSGRGMNGKTCLAVVVEDYSIWRRIAEDLDNRHIAIPTPNMDNMGLNVVMYWPGIPGEIE